MYCQQALMNSGSTHEHFQSEEEDPLAAFRPSQTTGLGQLAPAISGVPPIDFFVMVGECQLDEKPDTPPGTPDFFKMEAAAAQAPEELHQELEDAVQNMWLVEDNGLCPKTDDSSSEDEESNDMPQDDKLVAQEPTQQTESAEGENELGGGWLRQTSKGTALDAKDQDPDVGWDNPWMSTGMRISSDGESEAADGQPARSVSYARELFGQYTTHPTDLQNAEISKVAFASSWIHKDISIPPVTIWVTSHFLYKPQSI